MPVTIRNPNPFGPLLSDKLKKFEQGLGVDLPADYRAFLEQYNGGMPEPSGFWIQESLDRSGVHQFYGVHDNKPLSIDSYTSAQRGLPGKLLPIGDDGVGNYICIGVDKDAFGTIYFVDHEIHGYDPTSSKGITRIALSFSEFLSQLHSEQELNGTEES